MLVNESLVERRRSRLSGLLCLSRLIKPERYFLALEGFYDRRSVWELLYRIKRNRLIQSTGGLSSFLAKRYLS